MLASVSAAMSTSLLPSVVIQEVAEQYLLRTAVTN